MTTKKKPAEDDERELVPHFIYRKNSRTALRVIGLGPTQIDDAIKNGSIPPPIDLTGNGRAKGWTGAQLLELQRQRLAAAEAAQRPRLAVRDAGPEPPKTRRKRSEKVVA
jgi:hypothetical protein